MPADLMRAQNNETANYLAISSNLPLDWTKKSAGLPAETYIS